MAIEFHLLMPISKNAWSNPKNVKNIISLLIESKLTALDMPVTLWRFEYNEEGEYYDENDIEYKSLHELHNDIDNVELGKINFSIGYDHYDYEYETLKKEDNLPGINLITDQLKEHMDEFCKANNIPPVIDVFGKVTFGVISPDAEDEQGEKLGVGIYCDGNVAQFMEDSGFLRQLNSNVGVYALFEKISNLIREEVVVQFRY